MLRLALLSFLIVLTQPLSVHAEDFVWQGVGRVRLESPSGWQGQGKGVEAVMYHLRIAPTAPGKAALLVSFVEMPSPLPSEDYFKRGVEKACAPHLATSVEGKAELQRLALGQGVGFFSQLTDKSLVGKEPTPGAYKIARMGQILMEPQLIVNFTILFDDEQQPEVEQMMSMMRSLRLERDKK